MFVVARRSLAPPECSDGRTRLLLEGSWDDDRAADPRYVALDDLIDARDAWIDEAAAHLAEEIVTATGRGRHSFYFVNALRLRYALVKWLRILAYRRRAGPATEPVTLHVARSDHDTEYAELCRAIADVDCTPLKIVFHQAATSTATRSPPRWKEMLARVASLANPADTAATTQQRVLLCGNPRILGAVCDELLRRRVRVAWLSESFAARPWFKWRPHGAAFFECDAPTDGCIAERESAPAIAFDGVPLTATIEAWRDGWMPRLAPAQDRQQAAVARHWARFRPTHVVVDEDATPLKRIVLAAAQERGASSTVVQHGACGVRFGFAPLIAERIIVGDDGSRRQLERWRVPPSQIVVVGTTYQARLRREFAAIAKRASRNRGSTILLLCTTPPRDDRPDAVTYHLTTGTYEAMLTAAFAAAAELPEATLVVRRHPRTVDDPILRVVRARFPQLTVRFSSSRESLAQVAATADVVLSCASSAGIDLAAIGLPVIQLLPAGSGDVLPAEWYGLIGSARRFGELRDLLRRNRAIRGERETTNIPVRIVDVVLREVVSVASPPQPVRREAARV